MAVWLPQEVDVSLNAMAGELRAGTHLPNNAKEVEQPLAKFLAAQAKGSKEEQRSWVMSERGGIRIARLNHTNVVEAAFSAGDGFRSLYALGSAAMHGRSVRGIDLVLNAKMVIAGARRIGLIVLERICNRNEEMNHLASALIQYARLDHASNFGGTGAASTDLVAQQAFGLIEATLTQGVDYTGDGTANNPFVFRPHLQFHQASYKMLSDLGVDIDCPRVRDESVQGYPTRLQAHRRLSDDPLQRLALVAPIVGSYLRMQEYSDRANQPMLPVMTRNNCDSLHPLLVPFYESSMTFECRNIFPTVEPGCINQQSDFPILTDERIDLGRNLEEVVSFQFPRRNDFHHIGRDNFRVIMRNLLRARSRLTRSVSLGLGGSRRRRWSGGWSRDIGCSYASAFRDSSFNAES